jgi:hypothetical protein
VIHDRLKASLFALMRAASPRSEYGCLYLGRVVAQSADLRIVDVVPDDQRLPTMGGIELRGEPGDTVDLRDPVTGSVPEGVSVLVGWENGDPSKPFSCLWRGGVPQRRTLSAEVLNLGGDEGAEPTIKATTYRAAEADLYAQVIATLTSMAGACTGPLAPLAAGFTTLAQAFQQFETKQTTFLTSNARVR